MGGLDFAILALLFGGKPTQARVSTRSPRRTTAPGQTQVFAPPTASSTPQIFTFPAPAPAPEPPPLIPAPQPQPPPPAAATPAPAGYTPIGVPVGTQPAGYRPYSPLTQDVISTAQQVLRSRIKSMMAPDSARPGKFVLYQAEYYPGTTRRKVTAWMR